MSGSVGSDGECATGSDRHDERAHIRVGVHRPNGVENIDLGDKVAANDRTQFAGTRLDRRGSAVERSVERWPGGVDDDGRRSDGVNEPAKQRGIDTRRRLP